MGVVVLRYGSWVWVSAAASHLCHICVHLGARSALPSMHPASPQDCHNVEQRQSHISFHPSVFLFLFPSIFVQKPETHLRKTDVVSLFQVWQSPWGLSRDPEASAKVALLLLWERTVGTLKGNTRNTATTLSSATASLWTAASLTTDLKSTSTSSSVFFSSSMTLIPPLAGLYGFRQFNPFLQPLSSIFVVQVHILRQDATPTKCHSHQKRRFFPAPCSLLDYS